MGVKILFLDCDGVLNTEFSESRFGRYVGCDDDKLERLTFWQSTDSWCRMKGMQEVAKVLVVWE